MSNLAINDAGDILAFDGQAWKPAQQAANDRGDRVVFDGASWRPVGEVVGASKGSRPQGRSDAAANAFGQGSTFGFGDELAAGVRAVAPGLSNWMMRGPALQRDESIGGSPAPQTVSTAPTMQGRYDEELARQRAQTKTNSEAYPALTTGANLAGNLATVTVGGMAGLPMSPAMGPTLGGNIVRMGATGAGYGALQGFGEGQGGLENRINSAQGGALVGGVLGAATPVAGAGVRAVAETPVGQWVAQKLIAPVTQRIASAFEGTPVRSLSAAAPDGTQGVMGPFTQFSDAVSDPARTGAIDRIATAIQRSGMTQDQLERRLQQLGPEAMLADLDPQFVSQARFANTMPGETRSYAKAALEGRDRQAGNRIVSAFEGDQPPPTAFQLRGEGQAFDQNLRAVGSRAYGDMRDAGLKQTPELMALYENPYVDQAVNAVMSVEKNARIGRPNAVPSSPVEIMHKVKQAIWDMGFDAASARPGPNASYYRDLGIDFVNKLKSANPALAQADRDYAQAASLPEFFDAGRSFLSRGSSEKATQTSAPALADLLASADPQQVLAARAGATNAAREQALEGTRLARALAQRVDQSTLVRDKLVQLYGSKQADQIMKRAEAEGIFASTSNDILRGSKTTDKAAEILDNAGVRISEGGVSPRIFERIVDLAQRMTGPNEAVRNQIGRMTLTPEAERNAEVLRLAFEQLRKRRSGRPLAAALAGAGGASLGAP